MIRDFVRLINGTFLLAAALWAQGVPAPFIRQAYFNANGQPLSGGSVCSFLSGTSTPVATYTSYTLAVHQPLCAPLDASGRASIWLDPAIVYRFILKDSVGVTIWTEDGISVAAAGGGSGQTWTTSGNTIYNPVAGSKVCIGATPCTTALAQLNVTGTTSGSAHLIRIDDAGNSPGIDLFGSGNSLGSYTADSTGLRLRSGDGSVQMTVAAGAVTVQNSATTGSTTLRLKGGGAQGSANYLQVETNASSTPLAYIDSAGRYLGVLYNAAPATATDIAYKTANDNFSVDGNGNITSNGSINATGADGLDPYKVNGTTIVDAAGNATFTTLTCTSTPCGSGGGGGGSPGGSTTQVQYNNAGAFGGSANFTWTNASQLLTVNATGAGAAGIAVTTGFIQSEAGFVAPTATAYNALQSPLGGMAARSFTATKYVQVGTSNGAPSVTGSDAFHAGALYWDTGSAAMQVYDGASWVSLGGGSGSPGGSNTNVQYNSTGSFAGSGNFTWSNAGRVLTISATNSSSAGIAVSNGFIQADAGFLAPAGTATSYNSIQAPGGGVAARSFTATKYIQTGSGTADPTVTTSDTFNPGALYYNTSAGQMKVYNGSAWTNLGGTGGTPGGANTNVQFNSSGGFGGSSTFTWNSAAQLLTVTALNSAAAGIAVGTGFVQSDAGFYATAATATSFQSIQAPAGGVYAKSLRALNYTQVGNSSGTPTVTSGDSLQAGALYYSTSLGQLQVYSGASWGSVGGGGSGVSSVAGTANQVFVNGGTAAQTGAVTLSLPQAISTSSTPTFAAVVASGVFNSAATGTNRAFQTSGTTFVVNGDGNISTVADVNLNSTGGSGTLKVNGSIVINSSGQFVGANGVNTPAGGSFGSAVTFNGGLATNFGSNSVLYIGTGSLYLRTFSGGDASCGGVTNGWAGVRTDTDELQLCIGGAVKKVTLF